MDRPLYFTWDGDAMIPRERERRVCDDRFVVGAIYALAVQEDRSAASHRHYFASIREAWLNLNEADSARFPTPEHLRKYSLISTGYADERSIVCASKAEALRVASFIRPIDDFAVVVARDGVVKIFTAKSQSQRAMGKADFQASKDAVLSFVANMISVTVRELEHGGSA